MGKNTPLEQIAAIRKKIVLLQEQRLTLSQGTPSAPIVLATEEISRQIGDWFAHLREVEGAFRNDESRDEEREIIRFLYNRVQWTRDNKLEKHFLGTVSCSVCKVHVENGLLRHIEGCMVYKVMDYLGLLVEESEASDG